MNPALKYTLGRIGLFAGVLLVLWPIPQLSPTVKLLAALLVSFALSWFLLRRWRDEMSQSLARGAQRRRERKEQLRSALAGEDTEDPSPRDTPPTGTSST